MNEKAPFTFPLFDYVPLGILYSNTPLVPFEFLG